MKELYNATSVTVSTEGACPVRKHAYTRNGHEDIVTLTMLFSSFRASRHMQIKPVNGEGCDDADLDGR